MGSRLHGERREAAAHPQTTGGGGRSHNRHSRDGGNPQRGPAMGSRIHGDYGRRRRTHNRHSRDGGNPRRGPAMGSRLHAGTTGGGGAPTIVIPATAGIHSGGPAMGSRLHGERREAAAHPQTTGGGGRSHNRHSRDGGNPQRGPAMGSRLHGNDGGRRQAHPQTTGDGGRSHNRHSRDGGKLHGGGPAMGSRLHGNYGRRRRTHKRQWAAGDPTIVIPATAGIHGEGRRWVPVSTGTTGGGGAPTNDSGRSHNRHSRESTAGAGESQCEGRRSRLGNDGIGGAPTNDSDGGRSHNPFPRRRESTGGPAMGSRLHGNDGGRRRAIPQTTGGGGRSHNRHSRDGGNPQRGGRRWGSRLHGNDGGRRQAHPQTTGDGGRSHNRHSRDGGNPPRGAAMGSRLHGNYGRQRRTHKRREAAGDPTIVIPATAGIHRGGRRWGPVSTGTTGGGGAPTNDSGRRAIPQSSFPRRRESTARAGDGFPSPRGNDGRRRRTHKRREAAGDPTIVIPATAGIHRGGAGDGVPVSTETTVGGGRRTHKRRETAGDPTIVIPATAGKSTAGGRRWVPVSTGTTGGGGRRTHKQQWAAGDPTNDGGRRQAHPQTTGGGGRTHNRQGSGEAFVPSTLNSYDEYASLTVILAVDTITRSNCRFGSRASDSHVTSPF